MLHELLSLASQLIVALQTIVSRNVNPLQSAILTVGKINGGSTWNVIPDTVVIEGTVRTFDSEVRNVRNATSHLPLTRKRQKSAL